jgi:hypothetical protein
MPTDSNHTTTHKTGKIEKAPQPAQAVNSGL